MCGRATHPTPEMLKHARHEQHIAAMKDMIERLTDEVKDRRAMLKAAKDELRTLQAREPQKVA